MIRLYHVMLTMAFIFFSGSLGAQVPTGIPPFSSSAGGPDVIDLANLNVHLDIPVINKPGRAGLNFTYDLNYDSSVWYPVGSIGSQLWMPVSVNNWGWRGITEVTTGYVSYNSVTVPWCLVGGQYYGQQTTDSNWIYHDQFGVPHPFIGNVVITQGAPAYCNGSTTNLNATSADGSGALLTTNGGNGVITYTNGQVVTAPINTTAGAANMTDRNGNQITVNSSGQFFDTLSSSAAVLTGTGSGTVSSPLKFTYTAPSGASAAYTMNYTNYTVATNFAVGIGEYKSTAAVPLVSSIVLPDGSQYTFTYEPTPSIPSSGACTPYAGTTCVTARTKSIGLPTGGSITYAYSGGAGTNGSGIFTDGSAATLTRTITPGGIWTYAQVKNTGAASTTTVTDPQSNVTTIQFQGIYETTRQVASLLTTNTCYNGAASPCTGTAITLPITQRTTVTTLGTQQSKHVDSYLPPYGLLTESDDYDYGAPGPLLKKILINYTSMGHINAFPQQVTICNGTGTASACNGTGTVVSQTSYQYDETTPTPSSGTPQHVAVTGSRGNLTSITYPTGTNSQSRNTYYDTGMLLTTTDSNSGATTYSYAGSSCGNAFPTSATEPLSMSRSFAWNCTGGVMTTLTDENTQPTTTTYTDPDFWRPANQTYPDTGQTSWTYNAFSTNGPASITTTQKMNSSQSVGSVALLDGLGRQSQSQLTSDGTVTNYTTYDSLGRVSKVYNPTRCSPVTTNCGESTWGYTTTSYDALNRITSVQYQDGLSATTSYVNNTETVTDQAGKARKFQADGLGRVTNVWEDPAGLSLQTVYTYDALGNLTGVVQAGSHNRTYVYDGLSRLTSENNPESGSVSYTYNTNGDLATKIAPAPNQTGTSTVTTTYTFDLLHRLTKKTYSNGTATASFSYDSGFVPTGVTPHNTKGRLVTAQTPLSVSAFSYDPMGRPVWAVEATPQNCCSTGWTLNYSYDLMGNMLSASNGFGTTFTYTYDGAARPKTMTSNLVDSQHPAAIYTADTTNGYFPHGALRKGAFGNGLTQSNVYDKNLNPCLIDVDTISTTLLQTCSDGTPSGNVLYLSMGYNAGTSNNGNVMNWTATGAQLFARAYGYDSLNRVSTMGDTATAQPCKGLSWSYDNWSNRTAQTMTSGTSCWQFSATADAQNRVHDTNNLYQYDAAGNMTHDASHSYTYDAENRLTAVDGGSTANYYYDAFGYRVHHLTSSTLEYVRDLQGRVVSEVLSSGGLNASYLYFGGSMVGEYAAGTTYFFHQDHLGSMRLVTAYPTPTIVECDDFYPYGEANANVGGCLSSTYTQYKFTGDERDIETNLDHTWFRQNSSALGRWMTPDPAGLAAVDPSNPQSLNRYTYVVNNPLTQVDPLGLYYVCDGIFSYDQVDFFTEGLPAGSERTLTGTCIGQTLQPWLYSLGGLSTGGGGGGSSGPANNGNTMTSVTQDCLAEYNNSTGGEVTQFFSLYTLATNVKERLPEWTVIPVAKFSVLKAVDHASQAIGNTEFLSLTGGSSTKILSPTAGLIQGGEKVAARLTAPVVTAATGLDILANVACGTAGRQASGQMNPLPPGVEVSF